ncbi:N-acetylornithine carbamoyltransferase [Hymenobacter busanensis]|uniref:N-succinylornithine carbamoyltransferase n=1 Tax=Hymenobacter busanensis TaxID=2607656 RepID=A0A7L5A1F7_9BACT|nr:N-acetylornithine carbamoyltransferase [Hymenobacter busanensis]KAA9338456.1 N-acetylornithine carbamoyltransferase [Hymenobacter busanensis]QHJ09117.1 N-acetylornithine carbamoyltransferase [Hymenobacter busanensis]
MKKFTSFADVPDYRALLQQALEIKQNPFGYQHLGRNKTVGLIFFNPSLRTRLSSIKAAYNLGAQAWVLNAGADSWTLEMADGTVMNGSTQEHIKEAIAVMSQYCDVLGVRTFPGLKDRDEDYNEVVFNKILQYATVPVISLESATLHPLQSFADLITVAETKKTERVKVVLTWAPHVRALPQCVPNSFADWFSEVDWVDFVITHPEGYELAEQFTKGARIEYDQQKALEGADYVYAKNWSSYRNYGQVITQDPSWMVDAHHMALTNNGKFIHCLPVRRNVEVADAVLDSPNSLVVQEAGNRVFSMQTVLHEMLK